MTKRKRARPGPVKEVRLGNSQSIMVCDDSGDDLGTLAHALTHELGAAGVAVITYDGVTGDIRVTFRMGCHVNDPAEETVVAQQIRQACAQLSMSLRERYVERKPHVCGQARPVPLVEADDPVDGTPGRTPPVNTRAPKGEC